MAFEALRARCGGPCPEAEREALSGGRTLEALTNASLVIGLTAATAGVALLLFAPRGARAVRVAATPLSITLGGEF